MAARAFESRDVFVDNTPPWRQDLHPAPQAASPWPSDEEAEISDQEFPHHYGPYEATSQRNIRLTSPLSPVPENPGPSSQDQDAASPSADDMEYDGEESDRWSTVD